MDTPQYYLTDKYGCSIFQGQKLTNRKSTFLVIQDQDLGLCIEDVKTKVLEMLTQDVSKELEIVDERIYA